MSETVVLIRMILFATFLIIEQKLLIVNKVLNGNNYPDLKELLNFSQTQICSLNTSSWVKLLDLNVYL
jgi:hypothetical protein